MNLLDEHNIKYTERHIVDANPTCDELTEWYGKSGFPLKKFPEPVKLKN